MGAGDLQYHDYSDERAIFGGARSKNTRGCDCVFEEKRRGKRKRRKSRMKAGPEYSVKITDPDLIWVKEALDEGIMLHKTRQRALEAVWRIQKGINEAHRENI